MDWQDKKKTKQSSCYWFIFLIDNHQNKKQTKKILFSVPRPMSIQFFCSKTVPDPNLIEGYCKGFNSSETETKNTLDILTYTSISFYIPFRSVEIDFVDQDDRETHLNVEFIRLMSISFSVQFHSVPLRHILEIKMMIEKHTWTLSLFLWCLSVFPFRSVLLRFILKIKMMREKHSWTLNLFLWCLSVFPFSSIPFRWNSFWRWRWW